MKTTNIFGLEKTTAINKQKNINNNNNKKKKHNIFWSCDVHVCNLFLQYKTERDGVIETRVERKITVTSDENDDIDHDMVRRVCL